MIALDALNALDRDAFTALIGPVFEHSPWIAKATWEVRPFASRAALHAALCRTLYEADETAQVALIAAHPDLVGRAARAGTLTSASAQEQAGAGLDALAPDEVARFDAYNAAYHGRFGFPFVICARENKKAAIFAAFPVRLENTREAEIATALAEIAKIAAYRLADLVEDDAALPHPRPPVPTLSRNAYGKSRVRLTKVTRHEDRHDLMEVDVDVELQGDFEATYTTGDNSAIVATDSMKNTVYVLARKHAIDSIETFGCDLAAHFVNMYSQVITATVHLAQAPWTRIAVDGLPHPMAFVSGGNERRVCTVTHTRGASVQVESGLQDLLVLKTTHSEFSGFVRDHYTTLPETDDRIFATSVAARWRCEAGDVDWNAMFTAVRTALLETFAGHHSLSVQQTLYAMGEAALAACPAMAEITLTLPNAHRILVNLSPFGLDNPNAVFVPTEAPYGLISGTITRD